MMNDRLWVKSLLAQKLISSATSAREARATSNGRVVLPDRYVDSRGITLAKPTEILTGWVVDVLPERRNECATIDCSGERQAGRTTCSTCRARHYVAPRPL